MSNGLGEQLTGVAVGDVLTATVDGDQYDGTVSEITRQKCELTQGFIESGYLGVYVEVTTRTAEEHDLSMGHIVISAEEDAPQSWEQPTASSYDDTLGETVTPLGAVTRIEISEDS